MKDHYYIGKHSTKKSNLLNDGYYGSGIIIRDYYKKYGHILGETITKEILEINNSKEENSIREKYWVGELYSTDPMCINLCGGGMGPIGHIVSEEAKKKISEAHKGQKAWNKGIKMSEEQKIKLSEAHKGKYCGENNPMFGKHLSEETKQKLSKAKKGKQLSEEHRDKIGKASKGRYHTEETKQKMSKTKMGHIVTEDTRKKISETRKGRYIGGDNPFAKKIVRIDINTGEEMFFDSLADASRYMHINGHSHISQCLKGKRKTAYGYKWRYA